MLRYLRLDRMTLKKAKIRETKIAILLTIVSPAFTQFNQVTLNDNEINALRMLILFV